MSDTPATTSCCRRKAIGFVLLVGLVAVVAGGKAILFDTMDPDCFWHLRVAEQLLQDGIGPIVDRLSFASMQQPWTPYSWLAELGMKSIWDAGGYRLAVATQATVQFSFVLAIAAACRMATAALPPRARFLPPVARLHCGRPGTPSFLACALATATMAFISLPYLSFRPVTAALLLLAIAMALIVRDRAAGERTRAVWLCAPIAAIVVNLHLYAVFIPMWFGALLAGALWERLVVADHAERPEAERRVSRCFMLGMLSGVGCCMTPMLPGLIAAGLHYTSADPMVAGGYIAEMRPFFHGTFGQVGAAIVFIALIAILVRLKHLRPGERLMLAMAVLLLTQWGRFATVFAISAAPMIAVAIGGLPDRTLARLPVRLAMAIVLVMAAVRIGSDFPKSDTPLQAWINRHGPDAPGYPAEAARYVQTNVTPNSRRLISEFSWGGYLEWEMGSSYRVFLDGRTQLFTPAFWNATYLAGRMEREAFLKQIEADAAILPASSSMFRHALIKSGWRSVWKDERSEVLLPPEPTITQKEARPAGGMIGGLFE
ncbi:hypothetical protein [Humisphaera borealis]|uniref:Uncharacterized protein n=1 Tax=Humisphaera borealis TaxID=2807512 RepID=A0A7M2WRV3_9BACT|nr:hypothetical protein [Humisphaera borealis]QOV88247.1 hypothetical protein IPV69_18590 [Humisphaera borealis]